MQVEVVVEVIVDLYWGVIIGCFQNVFGDVGVLQVEVEVVLGVGCIVVVCIEVEVFGFDEVGIVVVVGQVVDVVECGVMGEGVVVFSNVQNVVVVQLICWGIGNDCVFDFDVELVQVQVQVWGEGWVLDQVNGFGFGCFWSQVWIGVGGEWYWVLFIWVFCWDVILFQLVEVWGQGIQGGSVLLGCGGVGCGQIE